MHQARVAINGYGRIGRCVLRALSRRNATKLLPDLSASTPHLQVVAINDLADLPSIEYLTRFDSTHGHFPGEVSSLNGKLTINGHSIVLSQAKSPQDLNWSEMQIDFVLECSGQYTTRVEANSFLQAGMPCVLFSQPLSHAKEVDATIVFGYNHLQLTGQERLISAASCTTNCAVPLLSILHQQLGIEQVSITTLHSAMNDQPVADAFHHADLRRTRSAMASMVPVSTHLAKGIERLMPFLQDRVEAKAVRVPILNVSCLDISCWVKQKTTADAVNQMFKDAAHEDVLGIIGYTQWPHASCDFNGDSRSAIIDGSQTRVGGGYLVNLLAWFDNEWAYANRLIDVATYHLSLQ